MYEHSPITSWAEDDKPREKLVLKGRNTLSDAELIAILIGSGTREMTAVELSKRILAASNNSLNDLGKSTIDELIRFKGIGEAKAISIIAALELGRRRRAEPSAERVQIKSSKDAFNILVPEIGDLHHEEFLVLMLNRNNRVTSKEKISSGGIAGTVVDPKIIFKLALDKRASALILAHNHPSGNLNPSKQDISLTKQMKEAGQLLDISVLDHLIVTEHGYYSFADEGMI
ncbi:MAG: DNA repair protein RadC [Flavobacteriales bacterium]|nr:DNA repair protein RadC [Flavobacteriales bacterium]NNK80814.1 DNA repair protein RadC [Flavobacteriales bacterium]